MTYIEQANVKPYGTIYRLTQEQVDDLVKGFVKEKIGVDLNLTISCYEEDYDMYVEWDDEECDEEVYEKATDFGLNPDESFMNRDYLFQAIFGSENIGYRHEDQFEEEFYEFIVEEQVKN